MVRDCERCFAYSLLLVKLVSTWPVNEYNYCPDEDCHFVNIAAKFSYRLFPVGEENVVLENWNYVLDRSVNVTTIVVQNNGNVVVYSALIFTIQIVTCISQKG